MPSPLPGQPRPVVPRALRIVGFALGSFLLGTSGWPSSVRGQAFELTLASPAMDRWMYPHNAAPGSRPTAPVFGTLGDESGVDSRHGQFLIGFDLSGPIATNLGPTRYLVRQCRLSVTVSRDRSFALDPTTDAAATYLAADQPDAVPDPDPGRPIELFGVAFRNGFDEESFVEDSPFGSAAMGRRNAFAAGYDATGALADVGNSVGKTNLAFPPFEARPFAVGGTTAVAPGELVPAGTTIEFDLDLSDPLVAQYVQQACQSGRLRLVLTSLQTSGFGGQPAWAEFHTRESVLGAPPGLRISGTVVRPDDTDADGLPDDWERHYFDSLTVAGAGDADADGASDHAEWEAGTDPASPTQVLRLALRPGNDGENLRLEFRHAPSRRYELQASGDLRTWTTLDSIAPTYAVGTGWAGFDVAGEIASEARFFRVRAGRASATTPTP